MKFRYQPRIYRHFPGIVGRQIYHPLTSRSPADVARRNSSLKPAIRRYVRPFLTRQDILEIHSGLKSRNVM